MVIQMREMILRGAIPSKINDTEWYKTTCKLFEIQRIPIFRKGNPTLFWFR